MKGHSDRLALSETRGASRGRFRLIWEILIAIGVTHAANSEQTPMNTVNLGVQWLGAVELHQKLTR